jgi:CoA:oxalate CoA-transferase
MDGAFSGIRVLDLTQIYNGPYATFLMAAAGADVVKVEPPGGEYLRRRDARAGADVPFAMLNGNKRSISLNLKTDRGHALFLELAEKADVIAENFAPGVMDRLGVGYDALRVVNPRIVFASGSGYGQDGDYRDLPAMDLTVQAMSGVMSITGFSENPPVKSGAALCDFFGGVHLFGAIAMALFQRERTGKGAYIDVSMLEAVYPSLASSIGMLYGERDDIPLRTGNRHGGLSLCPYNVYPAADGHVAIICNAERHWTYLCEALDRPDLAKDPGLASMALRVARMDEVDAIVASWTKSRKKADAIAKLNAHRVPCAPVRDLPEVLEDPALYRRGFLSKIPHPRYGTLTVCASPLRMAGTPPGVPAPVSDFGADNGSVYGELGLDAAALAALAKDGIV